MARLSRWSHHRLHRPSVWRLLLHQSHFPSVDQDRRFSLEVWQQPRLLGHRRPDQEQLQLGPDDPQPGSWQLRPTPRDHRSPCRGPD